MRQIMIAVLFLAALADPSARAQEAQSNAAYDFITAKMAAEHGEFDRALGLIDKLITATPSDPVLHYERAMILLDAARPDKAEAELRGLTASHPDFVDAQKILGRLLFDQAAGDRAKVDEALVFLQEAFRLNHDDIGTGMAVSQILLTEGRTEDAEKVLATLLERAPDQRGLNFNYAQVLTKLGRGDESRQYLERAVTIDPTFGPAILQLVDIYQKENEWLKAAEVLQPLISDDPMNIDLQKRQALFYLRAGQPEKARAALKTLVAADPKDSGSEFYLAEALSDLEQYTEADSIYRRLLERSPNDPDLLASYGLSQMAQRRFDDAGKTFQTLLKVPDLPDNVMALAQTQLAFIDLRKERYQSAVDRTRPLLVFHDRPNNQAVSIALDALAKQNKTAESLQILSPLVDKFGSDPYVNARYVELLLRSGEKEKARQAAETQVKFGPKNAIAMAEAYVEAKDFPSAVSLISAQTGAKPDDADLLFELGALQERSGNREAAEKAFQQLLSKNPENAQALNYLGYMWAEKGVNLDRAAEMLNRAVTQEPRNGAFVDSLGWVYYQQGKLDLAEKYLTDATKLLPHDATVHEHLGDVLAKRGEYGRALHLYRRALDLEPQPKDEAKIKSKISQLEAKAPVPQIR
jgi:predicted Zn-dependent protease